MEETKLEIEIPKKEGSKKRLAIFWARMLGWIATGCGAPIAVFATKFGLFKSVEQSEVYDEMGNLVQKSIALNGWGIVSCFLIFWTIAQILSEVLKRLDGYSLTKQVLTGFKNRIIPLVIAFGMFYALQGVIAEILFCLGTIIISQIAAIALNPLPQWRYSKNKEENYDDALAYAFTAFSKAIHKNK